MPKVQTQLDPPLFEEAADIYIPDLWGLAMWLKNSDAESTDDLNALSDDVLKCWHLCHSLRQHIIIGSNR